MQPAMLAPEVPADPVERLDVAHRKAHAASAERLEAILQIDEEKRWERDGATSIGAWLAGRFKLARSTTREWVRVAYALRELPAIGRAFREQRLSWDQVRPVTRFATPETDELWARRAPLMRPAGLWQEVRRHERVRREQEEAEHRRRYLRLDWDPERPVLYLEGMLSAEQGTALESALTRTAEQIEVEEDAVDPRGARLADALVGSVTAPGSDGSSPTPVIVVHTAAELLSGIPDNGKPHLAETSDGVRLSEEAVRRLACHAQVEWVLEEDGRPVGVGRRVRTVPPRVLRLLQHRDGGCRFPGCERRWWIKVHHLQHWARGGPTDVENLVLLCHAHHRLVHEGGWRIRGHPARELTFVRQDGSPLIC